MKKLLIVLASLGWLLTGITSAWAADQPETPANVVQPPAAIAAPAADAENGIGLNAPSLISTVKELILQHYVRELPSPAKMFEGEIKGVVEWCEAHKKPCPAGVTCVSDDACPNMEYGAVIGLVEALGDKHTVFFPPKEAKSWNELINGKFGGIGAQMRPKYGRTVIATITPKSSADAAGFRAGDELVAIDGTDVTKLEPFEAGKQLRGHRGQTVRLLLNRRGWTEPRSITTLLDEIEFEGADMRQPIVDKTIPRSPAEKAGLKAGDEIVEVDGQNVTTIPFETIIENIRGDPGTTVRLLINRRGWPGSGEISITRDIIKQEMVTWSLKTQDGHRIAVITIAGFLGDIAEEFKKTVHEVVAAKADGIVLDLRDNGGGMTTAAALVASAWYEAGSVIANFTCKDDPGRILLAPTDLGLPPFADLPTIVLVNENSASASEVVSGALQDRGIRLVGATTYGKGSEQVPFDEPELFPDGSMIKITHALWFTPKGRTVEGIGLTPDVIVAMSPQDILRDQDTQLNRALQILSSGK